MTTVNEREAELQGDEATIALRVMQLFELFAKLREAAGVGVPPEKIVEQMKRVDPEMMDGAYLWLHKFIGERFEFEFDALNRVKALVPRRAEARNDTAKERQRDPRPSPEALPALPGHLPHAPGRDRGEDRGGHRPKDRHREERPA